MGIEQYRGFEIQAYSKGNRIFAEVYRKEKLIYTIKDTDQFKSPSMALEATKEWIDKTYPKERFRYLGEV